METADCIESRRIDMAVFGIAADVADVRDILAARFRGRFRGWSPRDLLLRPREAVRYCDSVRDALVAIGEYGAFDLPDDVILRNLLAAWADGA